MKKIAAIILASTLATGCSSISDKPNIGLDVDTFHTPLSEPISISMLSFMSPVLSNEEMLLITMAHRKLLTERNYDDFVHSEANLQPGKQIHLDGALSSIKYGKEGFNEFILNLTGLNPLDYEQEPTEHKKVVYYFSDKPHNTQQSFISEVEKTFRRKLKMLSDKSGFKVNKSGNDLIFRSSKNSIGIAGMENVNKISLKTSIINSQPSPVHWKELDAVLGYQPKWIASLTFKFEAFIGNKKVDFEDFPAGRMFLTKHIFNDSNSFLGANRNGKLYSTFNKKTFIYNGHGELSIENYAY